MPFRIRIKGPPAGTFQRAMIRKYDPIAEAATHAMRDLGNELKLTLRADIAAAGFSTKWQNALRVDLYPRRGVSASPALFVHHRIRYAGVFEQGTIIRGKPYLWIPFSNMPKKISGKRMSPQNFNLLVNDLFPIKGARIPLLGARVRVSRRQSLSARPKVSLAALRRGPVGDKGVSRTVPIFFGVPMVTIAKKFHVASLSRAAASRLPAHYARYLRDR